MTGASCKPPNRISLTDDVHTEMGRVEFSWSLRNQSDDEQAGFVSIPVYLYSNRADFLFCLHFDRKRDGEDSFIERGVAIVCNEMHQ